MLAGSRLGGSVLPDGGNEGAHILSFLTDQGCSGALLSVDAHEMYVFTRPVRPDAHRAPLQFTPSAPTLTMRRYNAPIRHRRSQTAACYRTSALT